MQKTILTESDIIKAITNPVEFILNYCKIEATGKGLVPFHLYMYQKQALKCYLENTHTFILKSRQLGFTTLAAAYALWTMADRGNNVLFLSKKEDDAIDILRKTKIMHDNLPEQLKLPIKSSNQTTIEFENKNRIMSLPATERAGAGKSASLIIMDEFSAFPSAKDRIAGEDVWNSILPTLSTGGKIIVQSTPKGIGNKFYQLWAGQNGFKKYKVLWHRHPNFGRNIKKLETSTIYGEYTSPWAEKMMHNMTPDGWAQEFNGDFLQSGRPVFSLKDLFITKDEETKTQSEQYTNHFVCGVDLASGSSKDYHVAQFICVETGLQIHTMRSQDPIDVFSKKVEAKCEEYNYALLIFENNSGYGLAFMKEIKSYKNLYYERKFHKKTTRKTPKLGWNTNVKTKEIMITDLNLALINREIKLLDQKTVSELIAYQYDDNDKMNAPAGLNDDCVTSLAIAWQGVRSLSKENYSITNNKKDFIESTRSYELDASGMIPVKDVVFQKTTVTDWRLA
jgi:hypothetical protein